MGEEFVLPEKWCVRRDEHTYETINSYFNSLSPEYTYSYTGTDGYDYVHSEPVCDATFRPHTKSAYGESSLKEGFTEITFDQFVNYVGKKDKIRLIDAQQAQSIINSACSEWKNRLSDLWAKSIVLGKTIKIDVAFYKEMRKACTTDQNVLFDSIFGKDVEEIDYDKLKTGSKVMVNNNSEYILSNSPTSGIDYLHPLEIVFYKTPHLITDNKFMNDGYHSSYITLYQNKSFVSFSSDKSVDYITKVISY